MLELSFAALAILLGFKHSYDPDHLLAVANFLRKAQTTKSAIKISASWAIGHMLTAAIITTLLYVFRESVLTAFLGNFEKIVAITLILLGLWSLKDLWLHSHAHRHSGLEHEHAHLHKHEKGHEHRHMFGIGIIHGLASNDEMLLLFTASLGLASLAEILAGVAIFSIGVVIGMVAFAFLFSFSLLRTRSNAVYKLVTLATAASSIGYGSYLLAAG
ncbi:sulfite exporter TauE/SafE family protein [Candidatus Woesearchaeota archaeon]|nr:sulfite exporter TauE/SafE family protein [Candidatus Woesearchaeota archaeon]